MLRTQVANILVASYYYVLLCLQVAKQAAKEMLGMQNKKQGRVTYQLVDLLGTGANLLLGTCFYCFATQVCSTSNTKLAKNRGLFFKGC